MSAWPSYLTPPVDPLETRKLYQWQSANTRNGVVPPPEAYAMERWRIQHMRHWLDDREAQRYASEQESAFDPNYEEGV